MKISNNSEVLDYETIHSPRNLSIIVEKAFANGFSVDVIPEGKIHFSGRKYSGLSTPKYAKTAIAPSTINIAQPYVIRNSNAAWEE